MIVHAASGDTWGISGPTFLRYYLAAAIVVVAIAAYHRLRLLAAPAQTALDPLGPQQVAYLNGGPQLAVHAALGGLRGSGARRRAPGPPADHRAAPRPPGSPRWTRPSTGPPTGTRASGTCRRTSAYAPRWSRSATAWSSAGC